MTHRQRAEFQIVQERLCMPMQVFHKALEETAGRPIYTHELGLNRDGLTREIFHGGPAPTLAAIISCTGATQARTALRLRPQPVLPRRLPYQRTPRYRRARSCNHLQLRRQLPRPRRRRRKPVPRHLNQHRTEASPHCLQDSHSLQSALSEAELGCIGDNSEELAFALRGPGPESPEEQERLLNCLHDETLYRLFLAGFVPGSEPLSLEASDCVREAFDVIDPKSVMMAGIEGDPGRAMAGSMVAFTVATACLTDKEWDLTAPMSGLTIQERQEGRCLMEALGGPGPMAAAMTLAQEGDVAILTEAGEKCGLNMGTQPAQAPATPLPTPTPTMGTATPAPKPTTTLTTLLPTSTRAPATPAPEPTRTSIETTILIITVAETPENIPDYDRSDWRHWIDADRDCQDARQEVLIAESLVTVTYENDRQCRVRAGQWWAPHLEHHLGNPGHIDVDHHVPLKNAHLSGGWRWDAEMKEDYANYLEDDAHLVAISARHNRSKGARGPEEWAPPNNALWCQYAVDWTEIKAHWGLTMTPVESEIVMDMLGTCENPPEFEVETLDYLGSVTGEHKAATGPEGTVYRSCDEAAAAGEQRVQGSRGSGEGLPEAMVPSARDGDGDGVVCEQ